MTVETLVHGVRRLVIEPELAPAVADLVAALGPRANWRAFGTVPGEATDASTLRRLRSAAAEPFASSYRFLTPSPFQARHLRELEHAVGPEGRMVFEFLCLGRPTAARVVERWIGGDRVWTLLDHGLLIELGRELALALRLVPVGDHFYVSDTPVVARHGPRLGLVAAHLTDQTHDSLAWLRAAVRRRHVRSLLEVGSSIGLILLELRALVPERVGGEIDPRSHALSLVNRALRADPGVTFVPSNLFDGVTGTFDAIFFNPWQPSLRHLDVIGRFLDRAPAHLRPEGFIALWVSTHATRPGVDPVLDLVRDVAARRRFRVTRHVVRSWFAERHLDTLSCLVLDQRAPAGWRLAWTPAALEWRARQALGWRR
jgi:methylase of polypeptide subunit release factors